MRVINKHIIIIVSIFITFGAFVFGYSLVSMSMMSEVISASNTLSNTERDYQLSIITTLLPFGAFLGSFFTQSLVNKIGQRKSMLALDFFGFLVIMYQAYFLNINSLYCTRFLLGVYLGISSGIIPAYLVSLSPPEMTGLIGSFNQLLITIGISVAYRLGMSDYFGWSSYIQLPAFFCLLRMICLFFFKFDTLERHYKNNQKQKLNEYLALFYQNGSIEELEKLRMFTKIDSVDKNHQGVQNTESKGLWGWVDSLTSGAPKAVVMMGLVLALANQLSGINAIIYYAKQIFQRIADPKKALQYTYYLGLLQVIVTFFASFMINKYGRRSLMLVGSSIIVISLISAFVFDSLFQDSQDIVIAMVFLHIIGFSLSTGPVSMIYVAEIMQNISFVVIIIWVLTILVSLFSQIMIKSLGIGKVFLFYGLCSLVCFVYMYRHMVESKGLSRQQIVARLESKPFIKCVEQEKIRLHEEAGTTAQI